MKRYNISFSPIAQAEMPVEPAGGTVRPARWMIAKSNTRLSLPVGMATMLHAVAVVALMTIVRSPAVPKPPEEQAMALVFVPPPPEPLEPSEPSLLPGPLEEPPPPPEPVPPPPEPVPPPPAVAIPPEAPPPPPRPPVVRKTPPLARSVVPPRVAETPAATEPHPTDAPPNPTPNPTPPGPPAPAAPVAGDWQRSLAAWVTAHKVYPDEARRRGIVGAVALRLTADRSGRVLDVTVVRSAGSSILDAAAEAIVRNAVLPPFTAGMPQDTVTITIQLHYALTN